MGRGRQVHGDDAVTSLLYLCFALFVSFSMFFVSFLEEGNEEGERQRTLANVNWEW